MHANKYKLLIASLLEVSVGVFYHDTPCWLWSGLSWSARSTILLLGLGWYFRSPSEQTSVGPERCRSIGFFAVWAPLAENSRAVQFRLCVLTYCCLHRTAPSYLTDSLRRSADTDGRRRLRSSVTNTLVVATTNRWTLYARVFSVVVSRAWNGLSASVRTATFLTRFLQELKMFLFRQSL